MDVEVREIGTRVKNRPIMSLRVQGNKEPLPLSAQHDIIQVSLSNSEVYALDLMAGQFG